MCKCFLTCECFRNLCHPNVCAIIDSMWDTINLETKGKTTHKNNNLKEWFCLRNDTIV